MNWAEAFAIGSVAWAVTTVIVTSRVLSYSKWKKENDF